MNDIIKRLIETCLSVDIEQGRDGYGYTLGRFDQVHIADLVIKLTGEPTPNGGYRPERLGEVSEARHVTREAFSAWWDSHVSKDPIE